MKLAQSRTEEAGDVTAWIVLAGFGAVVAIRAAFNPRRTRGRACCAPADPAADLRARFANYASCAGHVASAIRGG